MDLAALKITGHINMEDSFSHVLAAAANLLGVPVDYDTAFALSTNAFSPGIDPGEDCAAWWHMYGRHAAADVALGALGLEMQPIDLPAVDLRYSTPKDQVEPLQVRQRRLCPPVLRQGMAGAVVITCGGWEIRSPRGFTPWCWWGVITRADDGQAILGATLNGHADNPLHHLEDCWAVRKVGQSVTADAGVNVLRRAVERIRGEQPPFAGGKVQYGLRAMDLWIDKMRGVPGFCEPCTSKANRGWACAMTNARAMHHAAGHAAAFLRRELPDWPEQSQPHMESAARRYEAMTALLQPLMAMEEVQGYQVIVGDLDKQRAHARDVLEPVRNEMAEVAEDIQQALDAVD